MATLTHRHRRLERIRDTPGTCSVFADFVNKDMKPNRRAGSSAVPFVFVVCS